MKSFQNNIRFFVLIAFITVLVFKVSGQHTDDDHHHLHDSHKYHLGFGIAGTYLTNEAGLAPGFHVHFIRQLGHEKQWGIGLGYEAIIEENIHSSINLLTNWRPFDFLSFNAGPGLVFGSHDGETEILPAFHTEAVFEFNLGGIHIGPMAGFGIDKEESHFSLGVHVGFGF
jgi:hypothetical protein